MRRPSKRTVAVVSGKGGVGKTSLVTNLALALQQLGQRVLLVDGDWGMANVDLYLGVHPDRTLYDLVQGRFSTRDILLETSEGVRFLPGASGVEEMENLDELRCERLLCSLTDVEEDADLILLDTSSGINRTTMHLARAADDVLILSTPEPASSLDAYATLRALQHSSSPGAAWIVVNQCRDAAEAAEVAGRIGAVAKRHLEVDLGYLGYVPADPRVATAVRRQEPLLRLYPNAPVTRCIRRIAERLTETPEPEPSQAFDPEEVRRVANMEEGPA